MKSDETKTKKNVHFSIDLESSTHLLEKMAFNEYLDALWVKLVNIKTPEAEFQLKNIEWMKRWLDRQMYVNYQNIIQARNIIELTNQIVILELKNKQLLEENQKLKQNIK